NRPRLGVKITRPFRTAERRPKVFNVVGARRQPMLARNILHDLVDEAARLGRPGEIAGKSDDGWIGHVSLTSRGSASYRLFTGFRLPQEARIGPPAPSPGNFFPFA